MHLIIHQLMTSWIISNLGLLCIKLPDLYAGQEATVKTGQGTTDWFQIGKGGRQGCILSPCLFKYYANTS